MPKQTRAVDYEHKYEMLWSVYRDEVVRAKANEDRLMSQLRHQMIANAQLHKELDDARELIDTYVDNLKVHP
jgi:hypothetical protein